MTATDPRPFALDRVRYHQDQLLSSRDLNDQVAGRSQLAWWHNRALHDAYGVVAGFGVESSTDATSVSVGPGLAYDRYGRELALTGPCVVPLPEDEGPMVLLAQRLDGTPVGRTPTPGIEFRWAPTTDPGVRLAVPLSLLDRAEGKPVLVRVAPRSRPFARPRIGQGSTPAGATDWNEWAVVPTLRPDVRIERLAGIGLEVRIDMTSAGFTEVPRLFAGLRGTEDRPRMWLFGVYVQEATSHDFVARVGIKFFETAPPGKTALLGIARRMGLSIDWLGVQRSDERPGGG